MANITSVLKEEITRLARKEIKSETETLKKASSLYRSEIADLKRRSIALEKEISKLGKEVSRNAPPKVEADPSKIRFIAKGFKSMREKLGITAKEMSVLLDISAPTIYNWEAGISKPKQAQLIRIAHLRTMNKKEVADVLVQLATPAPKAPRVKRQQPSKVTPQAKAEPVAKVAVKVKQKIAVAPITKAPVKRAPKANLETVMVPAKQPVKKVLKVKEKTAPLASSKTKVSKVVAKLADRVGQAAPKTVRKSRQPALTQAIVEAPIPSVINVNEPASIPTLMTEPSPVPQTEV